jgi:tetratricopeptide (TPR) repeat protein
MTTMKTLAASGLFLAVLLAAARPAPAADAPLEEARIRFQRGVQLFHEGSFEAALAEFRKAYQVAPSYRLLYNIGQVHYELHDYVGALKSFRQYLTDGAAEIAADRRAAVEAEIRKLEGLVAYLDVTVRPDGADVLIDDVSVGISPLGGPVLVNAGQRRVTGNKGGQTAPVRNITVAGGERVRVALSVPETPLVSPIRSYALGQAQERERPQVGVWVGVAATTMLALTAGGFAFATQQARQNFDKEIETFPTSKERIDYFRTRMTTLAAVTDALAAGALLAGGVTVVLAVVKRSDEADRRPRKVSLHLTPTGFTLEGGF